jgi:hypothetical protein
VATARQLGFLSSSLADIQPGFSGQDQLVWAYAPRNRSLGPCTPDVGFDPADGFAAKVANGFAGIGVSTETSEEGQNWVCQALNARRVIYGRVGQPEEGY